MRNMKRFLALLLSLVMILAIIPASPISVSAAPDLSGLDADSLADYVTGELTYFQAADLDAYKSWLATLEAAETGSSYTTATTRLTNAIAVLEAGYSFYDDMDNLGSYLTLAEEPAETGDQTYRQKLSNPAGQIITLYKSAWTEEITVGECKTDMTAIFWDESLEITVNYSYDGEKMYAVTNGEYFYVSSDMYLYFTVTADETTHKRAFAGFTTTDSEGTVTKYHRTGMMVSQGLHMPFKLADTGNSNSAYQIIWGGTEATRGETLYSSGLDTSNKVYKNNDDNVYAYALGASATNQNLVYRPFHTNSVHISGESNQSGYDALYVSGTANGNNYFSNYADLCLQYINNSKWLTSNVTLYKTYVTKISLTGRNWITLADAATYNEYYGENSAVQQIIPENHVIDEFSLELRGQAYSQIMLDYIDELNYTYIYWYNDENTMLQRVNVVNGVAKQTQINNGRAMYATADGTGYGMKMRVLFNGTAYANPDGTASWQTSVNHVTFRFVWNETDNGYDWYVDNMPLAYYDASTGAYNGDAWSGELGTIKIATIASTSKEKLTNVYLNFGDRNNIGIAEHATSVTNTEAKTYYSLAVKYVDKYEHDCEADTSAWYSDGANHYHKCVSPYCTVKYDVTACTESESYAASDGVHYKTCTECGYGITATQGTCEASDQMSCSLTHHWSTCATCHNIIGYKLSHNLGDDGKCLVCGNLPAIAFEDSSDTSYLSISTQAANNGTGRVDLSQTGMTIVGNTSNYAISNTQTVTTSAWTSNTFFSMASDFFTGTGYNALRLKVGVTPGMNSANAAAAIYNKNLGNPRVGFRIQTDSEGYITLHSAGYKGGGRQNLVSSEKFTVAADPSTITSTTVQFVDLTLKLNGDGTATLIANNVYDANGNLTSISVTDDLSATSTYLLTAIDGSVLSDYLWPTTEFSNLYFICELTGPDSRYYVDDIAPYTIAVHICASESGTWYSDGTNHYQVCDSCGEQFNKGTCTPSGTLTSEGGYHWYACTACKAVVGEKTACEGTITSTGDGHHQLKCSGCKAFYGDKTACEGTGYHTEDGQHQLICDTCQTVYGDIGTCEASQELYHIGGKHYNLCTTCGVHMNEIDCALSGSYDWANDSHSATYACGEVLSSQPCSGADGYETANGYHTAKCEVCGHAYGQAVACSGTEIKHENGSTHWTVCATCGVKIDATEQTHNQDVPATYTSNAFCSCGYEHAGTKQTYDFLPQILGSKIWTGSKASEQSLRIDVDFTDAAKLTATGEQIIKYGVIVAPVGELITTDGELDVAKLKELKGNSTYDVGLVTIPEANSSGRNIMTVTVKIPVENYGKRVALISYIQTASDIYYSENNNSAIAGLADGVIETSVMRVMKAILADTTSTGYNSYISTAAVSYYENGTDEKPASCTSASDIVTLVNSYLAGDITTSSGNYAEAKLAAMYIFYYCAQHYNAG